MNSVIQAVLNLSKLDVSLIKITQATATTFNMSIESRTTNTGPLPAKMSPMTVDLVGPQGTFGSLDLPEVKTASKGVDVNIANQIVTITNMDAYVAFLKSAQLDAKVMLRLANGQGSINALGMTSNIIYTKNIAILGMDGPQLEIIDTKRLADGNFENTVRITNPSPIEIDLGKVTFGFKNAPGELLATQTSDLIINRGETIFTAIGQVKQKGDIGKISLVGLQAETDTWIKFSLTFFNSVVKLPAELQELLAL